MARLLDVGIDFGTTFSGWSHLFKNEFEEDPTKAPLLVAAIDVGTTYSGWSYSFKHEFQLDPTKVATKRWHGDSLMSLKAPTCVLIKPDGETFLAFGYDAENKYTSLVEAEEHDKWYFFKRFKMKLYNKNIIYRDMEIEDETGKKLKANIVFSVAIRYLKDDLLKVIEERIKGGVKPEEVSWVLTVPAIWDGGAKQFMREAAERAGISSDNLIIALESEAAAIYCRFLPMENSQEGSLSTIKTGSKILVVDAGGGTVDIAVQVVEENGSMKNIFKASGGDWGGTKVDEAYVKFLEDIIGKDSIDEFKRSNMEDYIYMIRDFEMKKREVDQLNSDKPVVFRISATLPQLVKQTKCKEIHELIIDSAFDNKVSIKADKLKVDMDVVRNFFKIQVEAIVDHVSNLLDQSTIGDIGAIILVGGYSNCPLLKQAMKTKFDHHTIIVPNDPDLAVLKGAVIFGHKPELISQRVSEYTYGVEVSALFIKHVHKKSYKVIDEHGDVRCCNVFDKHITAGQCLNIGEAQVATNYNPVESSATTVCFKVHYTRDPYPMYITDKGCSHAGTLKFPIEKSRLTRSFRVRMIYGGTEIEVEATEVATGKMHRLKIDFLV